MLAVPAVLLLLAALLVLVPDGTLFIERAAVQFTDHSAYAAWVLHHARIALPGVAPTLPSTLDIAAALAGVAGSFATASISLFGRPLREALPRPIVERGRAVLRAPRGLHTGDIRDYVTWWTAGAGTIGVVCLLALR
jgi:hypothetical protein